MTLEVRNLMAGYGDKSILEKVSFRIEDGQVLAFFGHNGAGKSTTLKAVVGRIPARGGEIILDGERIERLSIAARLSRGLRLLPEGRGVFPDLTVEDNIEVVARQNCPRIGSKISIADVYDLLPVLAQRRKTIAGEMSGGQQQMLAFGLVLLGSPKCLLLEEPSVGLQPDLVEELFTKMSEICRSLAISAILIEHRIASALRISDHVIIINSGRIVFNDSAEAARRTDFWAYF
jgi:ABC-type branched-subunit amino acid transport system ATPase component